MLSRVFRTEFAELNNLERRQRAPLTLSLRQHTYSLFLSLTHTYTPTLQIYFN